MRELAVLCAAYSISLFYRGMISVIAPEISADLALDEARLGLLASSFFLSFAVAQIPSGIALDRFGGRREPGNKSHAPLAFREIGGQGNGYRHTGCARNACRTKIVNAEIRSL